MGAARPLARASSGRRLLQDRRVESLVERLRPLGRTIALGQLLLKLTVPGVPDIYQGDELETLSLVDPDNRRPVDWELRQRLLRSRRDDKQELVRRVLEVRGELGGYMPIEAGNDVLAFHRGPEWLAVVPLRPGAGKSIPQAEGRADLLPQHPVGLFRRR